LLPVGIEPLT